MGYGSRADGRHRTSKFLRPILQGHLGCYEVEKTIEGEDRRGDTELATLLVDLLPKVEMLAKHKVRWGCQSAKTRWSERLSGVEGLHCKEIKLFYAQNPSCAQLDDPLDVRFTLKELDGCAFDLCDCSGYSWGDASNPQRLPDKLEDRGRFLDAFTGSQAYLVLFRYWLEGKFYNFVESGLVNRSLQRRSSQKSN